MEFKNVVFNAARDGKLRRLKVSTYLRVYDENCKKRPANGCLGSSSSHGFVASPFLQFSQGRVDRRPY